MKPVDLVPAPAVCRPGCAACCIAPSITTPLPGHLHGKAAGEPCANLTPDFLCVLWGRAERPGFCGGLQAAREMCGDTRDEALLWLAALERETCPPGC